MLRTGLSRAAWVLGLLGVFGGLLVVPSAVASTSVVPDATDGVNGVVYASAQVGDRTFIGGSFSWAGPATGSGVPVDATSGKRLVTPRVNGLVRAAVSDGGGGWYVGGDFVYSGGKVRNGAARIGSGGATTAWSPQPNGSVHALTVSNGVVYLGGSFSQMGNQARDNLAAVDAQTGALLAWNPGASGTGVCASGQPRWCTRLRRWGLRQPRWPAQREPWRGCLRHRRGNGLGPRCGRAGFRRRGPRLAGVRRRLLQQRRRCCARRPGGVAGRLGSGHRLGTVDRRNGSLPWQPRPT